MIASNVALPAPYQSRTSSIPVASAPRAERRRAFEHEQSRDFAGVALGVATGVLVWIVLLSLVRLTV
jgi:hypothetical protein